MTNLKCDLCADDILSPQETDATHVFTNQFDYNFYICTTHYYKVLERNYVGAKIEALVNK
jgi:hypothetical protein